MSAAGLTSTTPRLAVLVTVFAALASVPVRADDTVECTNDKTYFPRGDRWFVVPPASSNPVVIRHQQDGPSQQSPIPIGVITSLINTAFSRWTSVFCGNGSPNIEVIDGLGVYGTHYPTRDRGDVISGEDPDMWTVRNIMYWVEDAAEWDAGSLTVAQTVSLFTENTGFVVTSDIEFNGIHYDWRATDPTSGTRYGCTRTDENCYDVFSVALHEAGHFFGFNHVQCSDAVMFPHGAGTVERSVLSRHETAGMCHVYRPRNQAAIQRDTAERCSVDAQCPQTPPHVCVKPPAFPADTDFGWCALRCTSTGGCPLGHVCADYDVGGGKFCKPGLHLDQGTASSTGGPCTNQQWACTNGACISLSWRCDGFADCDDGSDEQSCRQCGSGQWVCSNGACIPRSWRCNGVPECPDGGDEVDCSCGQGEWTCLDRTCIDPVGVCDGVQHCPDGSDETDCADPGRLDDLCQNCTDGTQCSGGVCVTASTQGDPICSQRCVNEPGFGCPRGFACLQTEAGWSACFPQSADACWGYAEQVGLNEPCYAQSDPDRPGYEWRRDCGPGLVCFRFKHRAAGQMGHCVVYCNGADPGRQCPQGTTCCAGVDAIGRCIHPSPGMDHGGCFQIQTEGGSCATAEQAICDAGTECIQFDHSQRAKCYRRCDGAPCAEQQRCVRFQDGAGNPTDLCCDADQYQSDEPSTCRPTQWDCSFHLGASCRRDSDCGSGLCLGTTQGGVCSRECNAVTATGCPSAVDDLDGDGLPDGGFECRLYKQGGRCFPSGGPRTPPACSGLDSPLRPASPAPGGCCSAVGAPLRGGDLALNAPLWLLILGRWWGRKRRPRRAWR